MSVCGEVLAALESVFKCHVCFHDYDGMIRAHAGPFPLHHMNPACEMLSKPKQNFCRCCEMEAELSRLRLRETRRPFFKCCHAGLYELAIPVFRSGILTGAMFAGPFSGVETSGIILRQTPFNPAMSEAQKLMKSLPSLKRREAANLTVFAKLAAKHIESSFANMAEQDSNASYKAKTLHFIERNFRRDVYLQELAEVFGVSETRTCQILRKEFNSTFAKMLLARRIEHAKYLLRGSMKKMEAIAFETGFHDASYFFRAFKCDEGLTPREYRMKYSLPSSDKADLLA